MSAERVSHEAPVTVDRQTIAGWFTVLAWTVVFAALAAHRLSVNAFAPVQRDGAFFLFMAQNIAHGQPAYWATFETKNPLVEYVWAAAFLLAPGDVGIVRVARVAEHVWILVTALALAGLCLMARRVEVPARARDHAAAAWLAGAVGATYLLLVTHYQVVDDGFNIAIYTTLPEAAAMALLLRASPARRSWGLALGVAFFCAWFVKQTSLFTLALPVATAVLLASRKQALLRGVAVALLVAAMMAGAFFFSLWWNGTLDEYWRGAVHYKGIIASKVTTEAFLGKLQSSLLPPDGVADLSAHFHTLLLYLVPPALLAWGVAVLRSVRRAVAGASDSVIALLSAWFLGATLQAVLSLLFFRHYFISAIGPAIVAVGALCLSRPIATRVAGAALVFAGAVLIWDYKGLADITLRRAAEAPINRTVADIEAVVPSDAAVFLWGGLPHYHIARGRPSDYAQNMWWPYIMEDVTPWARDEALRTVLGPRPPDYVIEFYESYPEDQALTPVRLHPSLLRTWTGRDYVLVLETPPRAGRYGAPARVFRRVS